MNESDPHSDVHYLGSSENNNKKEKITWYNLTSWITE